jgi:hypothetical protein
MREDVQELPSVPEGNFIIASAHFDMCVYDNKPELPSYPALLLTLQDPQTRETLARPQRYKAGNADNFRPSDDGNNLVKVGEKAQKIRGIASGTNLDYFLAALSKSGFDMKSLHKAGIKALEGLEFEFEAACIERQGLQKTWTSIPVRIIGAGKAAEAGEDEDGEDEGEGVVEAPPSAALKRRKPSPEPEPEPEPEAGEDDEDNPSPEDVTTSTLRKIVDSAWAAKGKGVKIKDAAAEVIRHLGKKIDQETRDAVTTLLNPLTKEGRKFIAAGAGEEQWVEENGELFSREAYQED